MKILAATIIAASLFGIAPAFAGGGGDPVENALQDHDMMYGRYPAPRYGYSYDYRYARPVYRPDYRYVEPAYGYRYSRPVFPYGVTDGDGIPAYGLDD